jgi:putative hemolysin
MLKGSYHAPQPIVLDLQLQGPIQMKAVPLVKGILERIFQVRQLNQLYSQTCLGPDRQHFYDKILDGLHCSYRVAPEDLDRVPKSGPVIVVANHPFGAIEGIALASIMLSVRSDAKLVANFLLSCIHELRETLIFVDPFGMSESIHANVKPMRQALSWLSQGGMLGVFPAGEVAHIQMNLRMVADPPWSQSIARMVRKTGASVLPVYFEGKNSPMFQALGLVHKRLRTAMLPRELLNKRHQSLEVRIGKPIQAQSMCRFETDNLMTEYLHQRTYLLRHRKNESSPGLNRSFPIKPKVQTCAPIAVPEPSESYLREINRLGSEHILVKSGDYMVAHASSLQVPCILREIARQREITFRQIGEGTGHSLDCDAFDDYYEHIFLWNRKCSEIVGAYRIGPTDRILKRFGQKGLYTNTLFKYRSGFFERLGPALEMGRSFIRPEYQRDLFSLPLLWKGIAHYLIRNPQYRILFGPVSISNEYSRVSKQLMIDYLTKHCLMRDKQLTARSRTPFMTKAGGRTHIQPVVDSLNELSNCVEQIEPDGKGLPVLLKYYLKLGGRVLAFNVDAKFSDALDCLILVDMAQVDFRIMERIMGREGASLFRQYHETLVDERASAS